MICLTKDGSAGAIRAGQDRKVCPRGQLTVRTWVLLVPPLEQPRLPVVPEGVCTLTLKLPAAGIMEDVTLAVSTEPLTTVVVRLAPLKTITEDETKWLPVAVRTK